MKKFGVFLFVSTLLLTGCGTKEENKKVEDIKEPTEVVCSGFIDDSYVAVNHEFIGKLEDEKITSLDYKMIFDDEELASQYCQAFESVFTDYAEDNVKIDYKCDENVITIFNYEKLLKSTNNDKLIGVKKDEFEKNLKDTFAFDELTCK